MTRQEIIDKIAVIKANKQLGEPQRNQLVKIYEDKLAALKDEPAKPAEKKVSEKESNLSLLKEYGVEIAKNDGVSDDKIKSLIKENIDYFNGIKNGTIGVKSVVLGIVDKTHPYMDTYNAKGKKTLRYYIHSDNRIRMVKEVPKETPAPYVPYKIKKFDKDKLKAAIISTLDKFSVEKFGSLAAYIQAGDEDRIIARSENKEHRDTLTEIVAEKIASDPDNYLSDATPKGNAFKTSTEASKYAEKYYDNLINGSSTNKPATANVKTSAKKSDAENDKIISDIKIKKNKVKPAEHKAPSARFKDGDTAYYDGKKGIIEKSFDLTDSKGTYIQYVLVFDKDNRKMVYDTDPKLSKPVEKKEKPTSAKNSDPVFERYDEEIYQAMFKVFKKYLNKEGNVTDDNYITIETMLSGPALNILENNESKWAKWGKKEGKGGEPEAYVTPTSAFYVKTEKTPKKDLIPAPKTTAKKSESECDELIEKEKERKKKAKEAADKRAKEPKKTEATKGKEIIEKQTDKVAKRADKGLVTRAELEKLIKEHESAITKLKSLLAKASKMETGGTLNDKLSQEHSDEFHEIKEHHCGCNGDKMEKGGKIFVYTRDGKKLTENLNTPEEAKSYIQKNQHHHKFPLAWTNDNRGNLNTNSLEKEIFPISSKMETGGAVNSVREKILKYLRDHKFHISYNTEATIVVDDKSFDAKDTYNINKLFGDNFRSDKVDWASSTNSSIWIAYIRNK